MKHVSPCTTQSLYSPSFTRILLLCTTLFVLSPGVVTQPVWADTEEKATEVGLGVASFVTTLPYGAVKLAYASLGAVIGGLTLLLTAGDLNSANTVWEKSLLGHYVITPDHLTGEVPLKFVGP